MVANRKLHSIHCLIRSTLKRSGLRSEFILVDSSGVFCHNVSLFIFSSKQILMQANLVVILSTFFMIGAAVIIITHIAMFKMP